MRNNLRIALAQINCIVGDLEGNFTKIIKYLQKAKTLEVDIISFPELTLTGYLPEDILLRANFIKDNYEKLNKLTKFINDIIVIVGFVDRKEENIYNAAAVIYNGEIKGIYHKILLPNYGVFDEKRYFKPGSKSKVFSISSTDNFFFSVNICEDIWDKNGPIKSDVLLGVKLIFNLSASPYSIGKIREKEKLLTTQAKDNHIFIAYTNLVGGQDELVFDGQSMVIDSNGKIINRAETFKEDLLVVDLPINKLVGAGSLLKAIPITDKFLFAKKKVPLIQKKNKRLKPIAEIYEALVLGLRDYITKNMFQKVIIGLSGGIDSAFVAVLAVDALGKSNVIGVFMPSRYSSKESKIDVEQLVQNLGIKLLNISIEEIYKIYLMILQPYFLGLKKDITEENIQARIRGNILMALSNKFNWLVLATGNKSEMSTGYATLYGDMVGGFAVIKDVPKTLVYKLAKYRNLVNFIIPKQILTKEPSAELKPNQKDKDTLPVYETLDPILKAYIEENKELNQIIAEGFDKETVYKVLSMVDKNEYKRRQSPPGIKITLKAFGKDRRMPITNRYIYNNRYIN